MNQLTHYFLFDPETMAITSHFSDEPMPAYGPFAILCISPLTYRSDAVEQVMDCLAGRVLSNLHVRENISFDGSMPMAERSQFVIYSLNDSYAVAMNNIADLEGSEPMSPGGLDEWDSLYDRTIKAAGL